jgi:hypothetical protein
MHRNKLANTENIKGIKLKILLVKRKIMKKATDFLNTDVGVIARDSSGKDNGCCRKVTGRDLDKDGDIGGKPQT